MHYWSELWSSLNEPPAALAAYLAALHLRLTPFGTESVAENVLGMLLEGDLSPQDLVKAQKALEIFLDLIRREKEKDKVIDSIEDDYYETFKRSLYRFLRKDAKPEDVRKAVQALVDLKRYAKRKTKRGSYMVTLYPREPVAKVEDIYIEGIGISVRQLRRLGFFVVVVPTPSGYDVIVPAPYTDVDILRLFEAPERAVAEEARVEEVRVETATSRFATLKPSREILESIVAEALRALGFSAQTNSKLPAKGGDIEVDVWATKSVGGAQFRVYVSCKNWDRDVDRQVVDHEFGRVLQLYQLPHLRVLVVRSLTEPARKAAFDDGFFVIELGEKASAGNAQEIYDIVYSKLKEIFIGIAPDKIKSVVERLRSALKELEGLV